MNARTTTNDAAETPFLQRRVALFGLVGFLLTIGAWVIGVGHTLYRQALMAYLPVEILHLLGALIPGATWVLCRGERPRGRSFLRRVEAVATIACAACFYFMASERPVSARPDLLAALIILQIVMTRAIFVPSSARRTALISTLAMAPLFSVAFSVLRADHEHGSGELVFVDVMSSALVWVLLAVALSTATSSVIYGLRKDVRRAQELGQYTLLQKLGEGGMGQVFRARHAMLRRPTAVKLLHASSPEELALFEREVQLTAQLTHPNTVTVFDYGRTPDGVFYYAMELLDGLDLQKLVGAHGAMPAGRVIHVLSQVAGALAEAHSVGLIHRDIKPANIILCARGASWDLAKVVDFGLVKTITGAESEKESPRQEQAVGTPLYIAPETLTDPSGADIRTDLYSLGAVGYFLLTGTPVFLDPTLPALLAAHLHATPVRPSARLGKPIPLDVETILLDCLAKTPAERPRDAAALLERLRACGDAGSWREEDARAWWTREGEPRSPGTEEEVSWSAQTIAVDLCQRNPAG
jgi:eukaryotic-like serine/threonine-protein kinase